MTWVRIKETFEWSPRYGVTISYRPGVYNVTRACAARAIAAEKAVRVAKPKTRDDAEALKDAG